MWRAAEESSLSLSLSLRVISLSLSIYMSRLAAECRADNAESCWWVVSLSLSIYSQSHLGWHFRKLKAQSSNVSFAMFQWKDMFELWALSFETAFENVTPSGIGCIWVVYPLIVELIMRRAAEESSLCLSLSKSRLSLSLSLSLYTSRLATECGADNAESCWGVVSLEKERETTHRERERERDDWYTTLYEARETTHIYRERERERETTHMYRERERRLIYIESESLA